MNKLLCLFILIKLLFLFIVVSFYSITQLERVRSPHSHIDQSFSLPFDPENPPKYNKYITVSGKTYGGLGNQLFRIASLYAIGRSLGRTPYFHDGKKIESIEYMMDELQWTYRYVHNVFELKRPLIKEKFVYFGSYNECCVYEDPKRLSEIDDQYLRISGNYLQNNRFFEKYENEIGQLFDPTDHAADESIIKIRQLIGSDMTHKLCIHVRRGDFADKYKEKTKATEKEYVEKAVLYLLEKYTRTNVSIVFSTNDEMFTSQFDFGVKSFTIPIGRAGLDLLVSSSLCNTLLITASSSTFAWWIAFLMEGKHGRRIYYNPYADIKGREVERRGFFRHSWIPLFVDGNRVYEGEKTFNYSD